MPSQTTSPQLTVTVLAALWVSLGRCGVSEFPRPGCDNGKLSLDKDLLADAGYWDCPESTQKLPSIDTVYDPDPAKQICMDKPIFYNHTIPSSGAYRPVMAESGEYLYCPPQRWLNNLHHGVTVLLYHPCVPLHERLVLSALARSCLPDYIITPHPQLNKHMPIALVSWGRTLELSTMASLDVCDWLETTTTENKFDGVSQSRKYNLLLTRPAELHQQQHTHPEKHSTKMKESLRRCCGQTISSMMNGAIEVEQETSMKQESVKQMKKEAKSRQIRAAISETQGNVKDENKQGRRTAGDQSSTPSVHFPPGNRPLSDPPGPRETPSQSKVQNLNQDLTPRSKTHLVLSTLRSDSLGFGASESTRPEALAFSSRDGDKDNIKENNSKEKNSDKDITAGSKMGNNEVIDVKEREVEQKQTHIDTHSHHRSEKTVSKSQSDSPPELQPHPNTKAASYLPNTHNCDGCKAGEHCECTKGAGAEARASVVKKGLPRTPRTEEAVWAAAALGFLLVLLTLSVLHTRLYRHWRTMPSLYWHDPRQDYDSVADVIRRRLRIAKRRRKRGRRQECVLLPSSSSSDEHP